MKKIVIILMVSLSFANCFSLPAKKENIPCPVEGSTVVNSSSRIKKIEVCFSRRLSNEIKNDIYFELLGYNKKMSSWNSLSVFLLKEKFEIDITDKNIKTIAIAPNKNCITFETKYENKSGVLSFLIEDACVLQKTEETLICENIDHKITVKIDTYINIDAYRTGGGYCQITLFYDDTSFFSFESKSYLKNDVYETRDEFVYSIYLFANSTRYLFYNNRLIAQGHDIGYIGIENGNIYYSNKGVIFKNEKSLYPFSSELPVFLIDGNLYYTNAEDYSHKSIWKNDNILPNCGYIERLSSFAIGSNDEVAYIVTNKDGSVTLYKKNIPYATALYENILMRPTYSPDGKKFYFIEGRPRGYYLTYYLHGDFPVPPTMGFLLIDKFKFSPNSKYIATCVEDLNREAWYLLSNKILGPFAGTNSNYHFSEDSKIFYYRYKDLKTGEWINAEEVLD